MSKLAICAALALLLLASTATAGQAFVPTCALPSSSSTEAEAMVGVATTLDCRLSAIEADVELLVDRVALVASVGRFFLGIVMAYAGIRFLWNIAFKNFQL